MKLSVVGTWAALLALVGVAAPVAAQQGGGAGKIAYVNTQAILKSTPGYAQAESTFTKELETYRGEVQKLQASLDSAASDFEQQSRDAESDPARGQAEGSRGAAAEAGAADAGAAAAGRRVASASCSTRSRPRSTA